MFVMPSFKVLKTTTLILITCLPSCSSPQWNPAVHNLGAFPEVVQEYRIQPGDDLEIKFLHNPELNERVIVNPDGNVNLQLVQRVEAFQLTVKEFNQKLVNLYSKELRRPELTVIIKGFAGHRIFVGGEGNQPQAIQLSGQMDALQAILQAGGYKISGRMDSVVVIRRGNDNKPQGTLLNLAAFMNGEPGATNMLLQDYDIVIIPKTRITQVNDFIENYIRKVLPFSTSASFSTFYEVGRLFPP
jgi:polysaccharide biosynthesis/export protein